MGKTTIREKVWEEDLHYCLYYHLLQHKKKQMGIFLCGWKG